MGVFFCKKWEMRVFCKKSGKWGWFFVKNWKIWMFFVKKVENGGGVFAKKWTFPQPRVHYVRYQYFFYFTFYLFGGCVHTQPPCLRVCVGLFQRECSHWKSANWTEPN